MDVAKSDVRRDTAVSMPTIKQVDQLMRQGREAKGRAGQGRKGQGREGQGREGQGRAEQRWEWTGQERMPLFEGGQTKHQGAIIPACQPTLTCLHGYTPNM